MASTLYQNLKRIFTKDGDFTSDAQPYILNRFLSFSFQHDTRDNAIRLDKYIYWLPKAELLKIIDLTTPQQKAQFLRYIKKPKEKEEEFSFIFKELQKYYGWSDNELKSAIPLLLQLLSDKEKLKEIMMFIGADKKHFKKYKIKLDKPIHTDGGLNRFFG